MHKLFFSIQNAVLDEKGTIKMKLFAQCTIIYFHVSIGKVDKTAQRVSSKFVFFTKFRVINRRRTIWAYHAARMALSNTVINPRVL